MTIDYVFYTCFFFLTLRLVTAEVFGVNRLFIDCFFRS
jgi:hypothetical protein